MGDTRARLAPIEGIALTISSKQQIDEANEISHTTGGKRQVVLASAETAGCQSLN